MLNFLLFKLNILSEKAIAKAVTMKGIENMWMEIAEELSDTLIGEISPNSDASPVNMLLKVDDEQFKFFLSLLKKNIFVENLHFFKFKLLYVLDVFKTLLECIEIVEFFGQRLELLEMILTQQKRNCFH